MSDPQKYTVGWICAITTEFIAAQALFDEEDEGLEAAAHNDNNSYALGRIGKHNVVMAVLPKSEYGITPAATVARDMLRSFPNIRIGLMVGIGGGAPSAKHDVRLGDIVVSTRYGGQGGVFQYDHGKTIQEQPFEETGSLNQPPQLLLTALSSLEARHKRKGHQLNIDVEGALEQWPRLRKEYCRPPLDSDRLYRSDVVHPNSLEGCDKMCSNDPVHLVRRIERGEHEDNPAIHYGLIASANQLMKDAIVRDKLAAEKGVLCFEMEAAGLMNHFPCLVIRGICDYSDSHKTKEWQGFAAMMAAAYAKDLLRQIQPDKIKAEKPLGKVLDSIQEELNIMQSTADETKNAVMSIKSDHHRTSVERWLSPPDHLTNAKLARARRHRDTGIWLLDSPAFKEWKIGSRRHLWLYGLVGCGKTVLSTTILDNLLQTDTHTTLAFFFDFNDPKKQTLEGLLRSLVFQLYQSGGEAGTKLDQIFISHDNGGRAIDSSALSSYVKSVTQTDRKVTIVIDALDECTTRNELLDWMRDISLENTQLLVTGRPEVEFQREIPRLFHEKNCVLIDKSAVNLDIRSYVTARLEKDPDFESKNLSPDLQQKIQDKVGDGADGM
ncbi:hypothetical protein G7Z17_g7750 [Cylindrodendrum hubeiense]|uniref:Nephrocystin 3-like N-terminal domain-containing protein n=1 Tax=Cylindrodendrum hubeiense TaxID=595255 RepID=A0A9P5LDW8_9HYPO|nr:hypothetical protein G7Z17_g7750 [Cylindrodendrum hubeiense]